MLTESGQIAPLVEAVKHVGTPVPRGQQGTAVARAGFDSDVPMGGATKYQPGGDYSDGRPLQMQSLYSAYTGCPWLSAPIDAIARTVTAGGLQISIGDEATAGTTTDKPPPQVERLQNLLDFCNPHEDAVQLLRGVVTDLGIYGDSFIEVVWLLGEPVALYSLDPATMTVLADEHGVVTGYDQSVDTRRHVFDPHEVIHISMDAPKGSLYGMGIGQKALIPVTTWLFTAATIQETMRRGDPPHIHIDFPLEVQPDDVRRWSEQYQVKNLGTGNIGNPVLSRGGVTMNQLNIGKIADYLAIQNVCRDTILSVAGVPPAQVGVIESGNLGGGTGASQHKALDLTTLIPTPSGWTTMAELHIGDQVLDETGRPCSVTGTYEVPDAESWRLTFSDHTYIDCCSDHLWVTWTSADRKAYGRSLYTDSRGLPENWPTWRSKRGHGPTVRKTSEVIETLRAHTGERANHSIPLAGALELPEVDLPIDPYVLGAWLGDGTSVNSSIACGHGDEQTLDEIRAAGRSITARTQTPGQCPTYNITGLMVELRGIGVLGNKHVPAEYLRASMSQRLALLQGLMDTDGGFRGGQQLCFTNMNERIADAVVELARSLGQKPIKAKRPTTCNGIQYAPHYEVTWAPTMQVFRLHRKAAKWDPPSASNGMRLHHRSIVSADRIPNRPMRCITVDSPNAMYLAGEGMIPTHNTYMTNTVNPIAAIVLEKLNFHLTHEGFGIEGWEIEFVDIDLRDDATIENIREQRIKDGLWSINDARADIGLPSIGPEGDIHILALSRIAIDWKDMADYSDASIDALRAKAESDRSHTAPPALTPAAPAPPGAGAPPPAAGESAWRERVAEHYRRLVDSSLVDETADPDDDDEGED